MRLKIAPIYCKIHLYGNIFYYFNSPTQPLRKHFIESRALTEYFADFLRYFLLFSVILARIFQIPYCFNILSLTISVFLLLNANKCSCYSVKWSAVIQLFLSNMEKWIPILTVWLRASQQGDQRVLTHTHCHNKC